MAHDCARGQAALASDAGECRFLTGQAREEAGHALVFQAAIAWFAPRHLGDAPFLPAMQEYRSILIDALSREDLLETFLAEQVILEGLGEAVLSRIEEGLVKRTAPFRRLRRILLQQEEAHHGFGRRQLERAIQLGETDAPSLQRRAQRYLMLTEGMVLSLAGQFDSIDEDAAAWAADAWTFLPEWLVETRAHSW
jgi:hypothetical protein